MLRARRAAATSAQPRRARVPHGNTRRGGESCLTLAHPAAPSLTAARAARLRPPPRQARACATEPGRRRAPSHRGCLIGHILTLTTRAGTTNRARQATRAPSSRGCLKTAGRAPRELVIARARAARPEARAVAGLAPVAERGVRARAAARGAVAEHPHVALRARAQPGLGTARARQQRALAPRHRARASRVCCPATRLPATCALQTLCRAWTGPRALGSACPQRGRLRSLCWPDTHRPPRLT